MRLCVPPPIHDCDCGSCTTQHYVWQHLLITGSDRVLWHVRQAARASSYRTQTIWNGFVRVPGARPLLTVRYLPPPSLCQITHDQIPTSGMPVLFFRCTTHVCAHLFLVLQNVYVRRRRRPCAGCTATNQNITQISPTQSYTRSWHEWRTSAALLQ